jgi:hypothetical protein
MYVILCHRDNRADSAKTRKGLLGRSHLGAVYPFIAVLRVTAGRSFIEVSQSASIGLIENPSSDI